MPKEVTIIAMMLIAFGIVIGILGIHTLTWRFRSRTFAYAALMLCASVYSIGYGLELGSQHLHTKLFWLDFQYLGISFLPAFWIMMAIQYVGKERWLNRFSIAAIFLIPVLALLFHYTDAYHHLDYGPATLVRRGPFLIVRFVKGPWYWVYAFYVNLAVLFGNVLFIAYWRRSAGIYRKQITVMLIASFIPWVSHLVYITGRSPYGLDLVPFTLLISSLLYGYGLRIYRLFDLAPIAREALFDVISDSILVLDMTDRFIDFNAAARRIFRGLSAKAIGEPAQDVLSAYPAVLDAIDPNKTGNPQISIQSHDVMSFYNIAINPILKKRDIRLGRIILLHDVSQHVELMGQLHTLAVRDDLTGVFKRGYFLSLSHEALAQASQKRAPISVVIMDLDFFKDVNDTYGHKVGDDVLKAVVGALQSVLRESDILGRLGGEEFVVFLPHTPPKAAALVAERLRTMVAGRSVIAGGIEISVTGSFGVSGVEDAETVGFDKLFASADRALYSAKNAGRNQVILS